LAPVDECLDGGELGAQAGVLGLRFEALQLVAPEVQVEHGFEVLGPALLVGEALQERGQSLPQPLAFGEQRRPTGV
jgi:hypothetical protein